LLHTPSEQLHGGVDDLWDVGGDVDRDVPRAVVERRQIA
jgi:hypothetical protein